jgi:hypothetical protein
MPLRPGARQVDAKIWIALWGLQLELVSFPRGMQYERGLDRLLWDPRHPQQ